MDRLEKYLLLFQPFLKITHLHCSGLVPNTCGFAVSKGEGVHLAYDFQVGGRDSPTGTIS